MSELVKLQCKNENCKHVFVARKDIPEGYRRCSVCKHCMYCGKAHKKMPCPLLPKAEMEVVVIAGSKSDQHILEEVCKILKDFQVNYDAKILSAHRNRKELEDYIMNSKADLFIAIAGLSAHLPGFIASMTTKPVIGVPVSAKLGGLDALLSIVQMPSKVPVACVGIDNGKNAALLAIEILSIKYHELKEKLSKYRFSGNL